MAKDELTGAQWDSQNLMQSGWELSPEDIRRMRAETYSELPDLDRALLDLMGAYGPHAVTTRAEILYSDTAEGRRAYWSERRAEEAAEAERRRQEHETQVRARAKRMENEAKKLLGG